MSSHHKRKRSHSRDSTRHSSKSKRLSSSSEHSHQDTNSEQMLRTILDTVSGLKSDMLLCNNRMSELENAFVNANIAHSYSESQSTLDRDEDTLSLLAGNDASSISEDLTSQSPEQAVKPPDQAIKPPEQATKPQIFSSQTPSTALEPSNDIDGDGDISVTKRQQLASDLCKASGSDGQ